MTQTMQLLPLSIGLRVCISYLGSKAKDEGAEHAYHAVH